MPSKSPRMIIILLVAIGFVCGFAGLLLRNLAEAQSSYEIVAAILDAFHQTILLIAPDSHYADLPGPHDTWLSGLLLLIGRLLLPLGFIAAIIGSLKNIWLPGWNAIWARWRSDHILIAGFGQRGLAFAQSALEAGQSVTSLSNADHRKLGGRQIPLVLDATKPTAWDGVALQKAKAAVLSLPSDEANLAALSAILKTARGLKSLKARAAEPLTIHVALEDAQTRQAFLGNEDALKPFPGCDVRPYSVSELIARRFFQEVSVHTKARALGQVRLHLLFAGRGPVNQALLLQFLKIAPAWNLGHPKLSLACDAPELWQAELENDFPGIETLAEFDRVPWSEKHAHPAGADLARSEQAGDPVTTIFADLGESEHNAVAARLLRSFCRREAVWQAPIYFQARRGANLAHFFDETGDAIPDPILPLNSVANVCSLSAIDGTDDHKAKQIHDAYLQSEKGGEGVASLPWEQLAETYRAANRRAADFLPVLRESVKAWRSDQEAATGQALAINSKPSVAENDLAEQLEHNSWCYERILAGWRYGDDRDDVRLQTPQLKVDNMTF